jgi:3D (Asp-Asp-Asp) domain-containing protein
VCLALLLQGCASAPVRREGPVRRDATLAFTATAYCDKGVTRTGTRVREGIVAADPRELPLGSVIRILEAGSGRYEGVYTVMDTGALVKGRRIDVYIADCREAKTFGVRRVQLEVVRTGWKERR